MIIHRVWYATNLVCSEHYYYLGVKYFHLVLMPFVTPKALLLEIVFAANVARHCLVMHAHHMTSVTAFVFELGPANFASIAFAVRVSQNMRAQVLFGFERFATDLTDFRTPEKKLFFTNRPIP